MGSEGNSSGRHGNPHTHPYRFDKDEFEVFIEKNLKYRLLCQ